MEHSITYVGLDVHKDTIAVAAADPGKRGIHEVFDGAQELIQSEAP